MERSQPALGFCPDGFADNGGSTCYSVKTLPIVPTCDVGALDGNGQCLLIEIALRIEKTYCPPGFQDNGKGCEQITEYDCSPTSGDMGTAVFHPIPSQPRPSARSRNLATKRVSAYTPIPVPAPPPSKKGQPLPSPPPPPKISVVKQVCQRQDYVAPLSETFCPPGFSESGKRCIQKKIFAPIQRCINGNDVNNCIEQLSAAKQYKCLEGELVGDMCHTRITVSKEIVCPPQTMMQNEKCTAYSSPHLACPQGTVLEGNFCTGRNLAEPTGVVQVACQGKGCWQGHTAYRR